MFLFCLVPLKPFKNLLAGVIADQRGDVYLGDLDGVVIDRPQIRVVLEEVVHDAVVLDELEEERADAFLEVHDVDAADVFVAEEHAQQVSGEELVVDVVARGRHQLRLLSDQGDINEVKPQGQDRKSSSYYLGVKVAGKSGSIIKVIDVQESLESAAYRYYEGFSFFKFLGFISQRFH